ncbi:SRPBCC family protein [Yinghuangia seranimata]|uniref:SRPBCC family protein n=1 Tax=Yinghuangia seranimata TaxID=408067 RepID=UPI00248B37BC|nr:SRPBCC family protein [Yinghuangia seranimata]MDI2129304.1 SRPBCC family protein [Yinghuangia seranimata]
MWEYQHAVETTASASAIWKLWADVDGWSTWNADVEKIDLRGPFAEGSEFTMYMPGQDPVTLTLGSCVENEHFVDRAEIEGLVLTTTHRIAQGGDGKVQVVYHMTIDGPGADEVGAEIGPAITGDWPETVAALIARAEERD